MDIVRLVAEHEQELVLMRDKSALKTERDRARILLRLGAGMSQRSVARYLGHARSHVNAVVRRFRDDGVAGLKDRRRGQRLPKRAEIIALLPRLLQGSPSDFGWSRSTWSVEVIALEVKDQLGVRVSRTHMGRLLRRAGCRRVRPKPTVALAPDDAAERIAELDAVLSELPADDLVVYADEVDIHLNPKVGPDWMPKGMRKTVATPGRNKKHYIAGAYVPSTDELVTVDGERKNSDLFIALLHELVARHEGDDGVIHVVLDNYIIHKSKKTQRAIEKLGGKVELHFLPPYSPDANPIERVWWDLHAHVTRNHRHATLEDLMAAVRHYIEHYDLNGARQVTRLRTAA